MSTKTQGQQGREIDQSFTLGHYLNDPADKAERDNVANVFSNAATAAQLSAFSLIHKKDEVILVLSSYEDMRTVEGAIPTNQFTAFTHH